LRRDRGACSVSRFCANLCAALAATASLAAPLPPRRPSAFSTPAVAPPLPPPRPDELPAPAPVPAPAPQPEKPEDSAACDALLASGAVVAERLAPITGDEGCGIALPVSLVAVILPNRQNIPIEPHPVLRCDLAAEAAHWIAEDLIPAIEQNGRRVVRLIGAGGYQCRSRNAIPGAVLSEHARGNALDLGGVALADGNALALSDMSGDLEAATAIRAAACARFATVLGPGSDGAHESHIHVDLEPRRNGGRICEWDLR
jgi:hypothetical protein